ncbi:PAS domain-containing protein [Hymenobacter sp. IS2118]|uniref:PAS domain-containing protein n=1 Tax=Hymenobacter sp. IS2118 TaxID=1505605 RepID=UPI000689FD09|nr:PAS domain-containing protein [Hymenobacter sp. IS2118]
MSEALPAQFPPAELLPALLDASLTGVVLFVPVYGPAGELVDFSFAYLNPAAQRILGLPPQPAVSYLQQFPHSTDPANGAFVFQRDAYLSGQAAQFELNYQNDGYDNYFRATARRVGEGLLVCVTDTADQPRTAVEVALRQSQARERAAHAEAEAQRQRLLNVFAQAPVLMTRLSGPDYVVELANEGYRQLFGARHLTGRPYREAAPELVEQGFFELLDAVYRTGETYTATEAPVYLRPAGPGPLVLRYFDFIYQATRDAAGCIDGVLVVGHEVTEPVLARQLLEEQARQLAQLNQELEARVFERTQALRHARAETEATAQKLLRVTESQPGISFTVDQSGQVLYISPQWYAYTGMEPSADVTEAWPQLIHPDDLPLVAEQYGAALAGGGPWRYEFRLRGADGQYRWFTNQGVPELLADAEAAGRPRQWFGSNLDIDDLKRAQQQIEEKDQLLTSILSSLPASVVTFEGEDLRFGFFNESYQRQGQGRVVLGRPAGEVFPEAEQQGFLALLRRVLHTGEPYQGQEVPAYIRDPHTGQQQDMYVDRTYLPLRHGQQPPHAVLGFTVDVTDRVLARRQAETAQGQALAAAEQAVAQREAFYQVFEQTPACIALLREPSHRFEYVNPAYQQLFPGRQLVGRTVAEALPEVVEHGFLALLDGVFQTGETYFGQQMLLPVTLTDGQPPQDAYFDFTYQALREAGHIVGISIFATDVTERVLARRQREAQQVQLAELFEQAPVAITVLRGPQYVIEVANPLVAQLWGRTPEQVRGKALYDALPEVRDQGFKELLDQVVASGEAFVAQEVPAQLPRAGQLETVYLNFVYQPLRDAQGRIDSVAAVATDVTAQVLARQQLAQANEQLTAANSQLTRTNLDLDNFVYTASHDLKQPIANIEGLLTALREELVLPPAQAAINPLLDRMQGAVERFKRTIAQLTDIAKLQAAHDPQPPTEVDLAALVADVRQDLRPEFQAIGAALTVDVTGCPTLAFAEKNLRSVVFNLLSNALKYRHPDRVPQLRLRCHTAEAFTVLELQDNGLGLDPAQQKKLFGLFQRLHVHVEGSGIGLYMVKKMVENAGGRIEVDSQPGIGSTFRLYFPLFR